MKKLLILILFIFFTSQASEIVMAIKTTDLSKVVSLLNNNKFDNKKIKKLSLKFANETVALRKDQLNRGEWWASFGFNAISDWVPGEGRYIAGALINSFLFFSSHSIANALPEYKHFILGFSYMVALSSVMICNQKIYDLKLVYVKQRYEDSLKIKELVTNHFIEQ